MQPGRCLVVHIPLRKRYNHYIHGGWKMKNDIESLRLIEDTKLAREIFEQPTDNPGDKDVFEIIRDIEAKNKQAMPKF